MKKYSLSSSRKKKSSLRRSSSKRMSKKKYKSLTRREKLQKINDEREGIRRQELEKEFRKNKLLYL
jgi:CMP-N-acetylneuraminic acid synthetase